MVAALMAATLSGSTASVANAAYVLPTTHENNTIVVSDKIVYENQTESDVSILSTSIPSKNNCIDLSIDSSVLGFQISSLRYGNLFTNYCFTGVSSVKVKVGTITVNKNGSSTSSKNLTVHLHEIGSNLDVTYSVSTSGGAFYYLNLDSTKKYYLEFSKVNDGQLYSFSGSVVKK